MSSQTNLGKSRVQGIPGHNKKGPLVALDGAIGVGDISFLTVFPG
jgi:hypothetical protein